MLYQLSYSRRFTMLCTRRCCYRNGLSQNGGEGNRTPDLVNAIHALSQLSYAPVILGAREAVRSKPTTSWSRTLTK